MTGKKKVKKTTKPRARDDRSHLTRARNNGVAKKKTQKKELNDSRGI
jgi:hypothetical protein